MNCSDDVQGSATLSMAYAGALFADACIRGLNGEPDVEEYTFVESKVVGELPFFSSKVRLGPSGEPPDLMSPHCARASSIQCMLLWLLPKSFMRQQPECEHCSEKP